MLASQGPCNYNIFWVNISSGYLRSQVSLICQMFNLLHCVVQFRLSALWDIVQAQLHVYEDWNMVREAHEEVPSVVTQCKAGGLILEFPSTHQGQLCLVLGYNDQWSAVMKLIFWFLCSNTFRCLTWKSNLRKVRCQNVVIRFSCKIKCINTKKIFVVIKVLFILL